MNNPNPASSSQPNDSASAAEEDSSASAVAAGIGSASIFLEASKGPTEKTDIVAVVAAEEEQDEPPMAMVLPEKEAVGSTADDPMDVDNVNPATVFCIRLKQPKSNLLHKMSVPELCRNFSAVAWCGKLNAIACASETCARIPSSHANPPFWIPIHIVIPERPTECAVFNVIAGL